MDRLPDVAVVVDCYNVLHAPMPPALAGLDEAGLCRALARLAAAGRWRGPMTVVCDGVVKPLGLTESPEASVDLVYSGRNQTADAVIIRMVAAESAPRRLVVISNDREIEKAAKRRGAKALSCGDFVHLLLSTRASPYRDDKPGGQGAPLTDDEVEAWLKRFGVKDNR